MKTACSLRRLADVAALYSGSNVKSAKTAFGPGSCPWVRVEDLNGTRIGETANTLTPEGERGVRVVPPETVLLSSVGTIGKVGIAGRPVAPSNNIIALEFRPDLVLPLYGMYCLAALRTELEAQAKGSVYDSLRLSRLQDLMIPVPDLETQRHIAGQLDLLRQGVDTQEQALSSARHAACTAFDRAFGAEIRGALVHGTGLRLADCADIRLNGALKKTRQDGPQAPYVATPQLQDWEVEWDAVPAVQVEPAALERYGLRDGDIVMNRINQASHLGRCGLIAAPPPNALFAQNTLCIRAKEQQVLPAFLMAWLTHPSVKEYLRDHAKHSTSFQSSLSRSVVDTLPVPRVELSRQQAFAQIYGDYLEYTRNGRRIVERLRSLQALWYRRIRLLRQEAVPPAEQGAPPYRRKRVWITPAGTRCFYDPSLECIQASVQEARGLIAAQLPLGVEVQFVEDLRSSTDPSYGSLEQLRLYRTGSSAWSLVRMKPVAYRPDGQDLAGETARQLESAGLLSEAQDFGYLREVTGLNIRGSTPVDALLEQYAWPWRADYSRFDRLPPPVLRFVAELSPVQQAVYEEFLLAMQPLTCHMVHRQLLLRAGRRELPGCGMQDVVATVELLEDMGLLERRQGLVLEYDDDGDYGLDGEHRPILDHRGRTIPMDTWIWAAPKE